MAALKPEGPNADQIKHWNEVAGPTWVAQNDAITAQIRPLGELAMARAELVAGDRVLDVGCGCGETTLEIARRVGPSGAVVGVDVSAPMLELARDTARRAGVENARFELADAQTAELPERSFDKLYSRFGVMFFRDPDVAFTNLRRALRPGGRVSFVCWRAPMENPWMIVPAMAVMPHAPVTMPDPAAPGPFALADRARVEGILSRAGLTSVAMEPVDTLISVGGPGADLDAAVGVVMQMGAARAALQGATEEVRAAAARSIKEAFAPYHTADGVQMPSASWLVTAKAP